MKKKANKAKKNPKSSPRIYVENMRTNKGKWIDLDSFVGDEIEKISGGDDWMVADYEDAPNLGQHPGLEDLESLANLLDEHEPHIVEAALGITGNDVDDAKEYLEEGYGEYGSEGEYAESMVDEGIIDTKTLLRYIDYDALGRDLAIEGNVHETKNGIVVFNRS